MKLLSLSIKNIGLIISETILLSKPLLLFYGEIQQGKTTILNAVRYVFGGAFPSDLLRHGEKEGHIRLDFEGGYILREFYRADDGSVKARPLVFEQDGKRVPRPVEALKKFLNPFLLDQDHLARMTELERRKYFTELFNVNTDALDNEDEKIGLEAQGLRSEVKAFGEIDLVEFKRVNVQELRESLAEVKRGNTSEQQQVYHYNQQIDEHNKGRQARLNALSGWTQNIAELESRLREARVESAKIEAWLSENPERTDKAEPELRDTAELEGKIQTALADNVRAELYEKNVAREQERKAKNLRVTAIENRQREIYHEKEAHLTKLSQECGVEGLRFLPKGDFEYQGARSGMLSTSQLMDLSLKISGLYPKGFGLDLIDRAESMGKAVFLVVERAKAENKTILATIVGERPATVPEDIGVFVVEGGKIS